MFTEAVTLDVFYNHHAIGFSGKQRTVDYGIEILVVADCQVLHSFCPSFRGLYQAFTARVFADLFEHLSYKVLHG